EYHTSLDNLNLITPTGLEGGYLALRRAIEIIERNDIFQTRMLCEPQLGKRGLYPALSTKSSVDEKLRATMNLIAFCDGTRTLLEIADVIGEPFWELVPIVEELIEHQVLKRLPVKVQAVNESNAKRPARH